MLASSVALLAVASLVSAHGALVAIQGANGIEGQGFGIVPTTPRDGTRRNPFQADTSVFKANAGACGQTAAGQVDIRTNTAAAVAAGVPSIADDGTVSMTIHQVNGDGAGPYTCGVSTDATGSSFVAMSVLTNVPGTNSRSNAKATDFPLVAAVPAGTTCTGAGATCLVRCMNAARAGPFGGCALVSQEPAAAAVAPAGAATNATAPAAAVARFRRRSVRFGQGNEPLVKRVKISFGHLFKRDENNLTDEEIRAIALQDAADDADVEL